METEKQGLGGGIHHGRKRTPVLNETEEIQSDNRKKEANETAGSWGGKIGERSKEREQGGPQIRPSNVNESG